MFELDASEWMKPKCPVKVGDKFYRKTMNASLNPIIVMAIKDAPDGKSYVITGKYENTAIGYPIRLFSSQMINEDDYVIIRKGGSNS